MTVTVTLINGVLKKFCADRELFFAMSEIDDIFASKGKTSAIPTPSPAAPAPSLKKKKKSKKKAQKAPTPPPAPVEEKATSKKRPAPETIVDPSLSVTQKRQKVRPPPEQTAKAKKDKDDEDDFKDSRGTGPRRKTEEGWGIFKEAELGIDPTAGDTPLCPFDCDCS
ncbi:hypothetical protein D9611_003312 [Ephemerocybe angulata]|uniref:DUF1764-domain-containing protein n=1 Tax=Ephemerocybe angulata TaxID=980116 RepID=A0A8H5C8Z6_9AGAR|nr:hypothetical protein D9611_003312 [Tulosesus angulatus]